MKKNNSTIFLIFLIFILFSLSKSYSEIIVLSKCDHKEDVFLKNEYILNLNELTMTRIMSIMKKLIKNIELQI